MEPCEVGPLSVAKLLREDAVSLCDLTEVPVPGLVSSSETVTVENLTGQRWRLHSRSRGKSQCVRRVSEHVADPSQKL